MVIDLRGLSNPEHIKGFKDALEGQCTISEDIEVLLDNSLSDSKRFEAYIRSCNCRYEKKEEIDTLRIIISAPFSFCG